jgi:hypothetical protein
LIRSFPAVSSRFQLALDHDSPKEKKEVIMCCGFGFGYGLIKVLPICLPPVYVPAPPVYHPPVYIPPPPVYYPPVYCPPVYVAPPRPAFDWSQPEYRIDPYHDIWG